MQSPLEEVERRQKRIMPPGGLQVGRRDGAGVHKYVSQNEAGGSHGRVLGEGR